MFMVPRRIPDFAILTIFSIFDITKNIFQISRSLFFGRFLREANSISTISIFFVSFQFRHGAPLSILTIFWQ